MAKRKEAALTYEEAFEKYYGGLKEVMKKPLPIRCLKCNFESLTLERCWEHIRHVHSERIVTPKAREKYDKNNPQ